MAALHSGETADLGDCLGSDAQTVTALALGQASPVWPLTAMVSLGHRHSGSMFGSNLLHSPMATLPSSAVLNPQDPQRVGFAGYLPAASFSASEPGRRTTWGFQSDSTGHVTIIEFMWLFSFYFQVASIPLPLGMQMSDARILALEDT